MDEFRRGEGVCAEETAGLEADVKGSGVELEEDLRDEFGW